MHAGDFDSLIRFPRPATTTTVPHPSFSPPLTGVADGANTYVYEDDNLIELIDPDGNITRFTYNSANQVTSKTDPLGNVTSYTYNGAGLLATQTNPDGTEVAYAYDAAGQKTYETLYAA